MDIFPIFQLVNILQILRMPTPHVVFSVHLRHFRIEKIIKKVTTNLASNILQVSPNTKPIFFARLKSRLNLDLTYGSVFYTVFVNFFMFSVDLVNAFTAKLFKCCVGVDTF